MVAVDAQRRPIPIAESRLADRDTVPPAEAPPRPPVEPVSTGPAARKTTPVEPPEREATVRLGRAPIGLSVYVLDDDAVLTWAERNPVARELLHSDLVAGVFQDALRTARVRGEDLKIEGVRGAFLAALARDVLGARAALHYDVTQGRRGWVLSFRRRSAPLVSRILPPVLGALARRQYRLEKIGVPIVEVLVGEQSLFLAEVDGSVYVGNSLPAVLQVVEVGPLPAPADADGSVAVALRAEAWVQNLLPVLTGAREWHATWSVDLRRDGSPGTIRASGGALFAHLRPAVPPGILASIPRDAFAAVAGSFPVPHGMTPDDWNRIARDGVPAKPAASGDPAGIALVWDLSARNPALSEVGLAVQLGGGVDASELAGWFRADVHRATCAGGSIWLAGTTELLLTRMREACERQSPSLLDWRERRGAGPPPQLVLLVNPAPGLDELLDAGIGTATETRASVEPAGAAPDWKQAYRAAVDRARASATATIAMLPGFVYEGTATTRGATLDGALVTP